MLIRTRLMGAVVLAMAGLSLVACAGGSDNSKPAPTEDSGPLRFGTEGTYEPFSFHDRDTEKLTGYDIEVAEAVAHKLGRQAEFSENAIDTILAGLEAQKVDIVASEVSVTPERQDTYSFSQPYAVNTGVVVTRADNTSVTSAADIKGKTSAQSATSIYVGVAREGGAEVEPVESFSQALTLLRKKRVDITLNDNLAMLDYLKTTGDSSVKIATSIGDPTHQAFVFRKNSPLAARFDQALKELRTDGTLTKISKKWFGQDISGPTAS